MKRSALVLCLLGSASTACFRPTVDCARCGEGATCPAGLTCNAGFCSAKDEVCATAAGTSDGSADDRAPIDGDGGKSSICVGGSCLTMPPSVRDGLVVWADRTSLPPGGQPITTWIDRSGNNHPVTPFNPASPPLVQLDPVGRLAGIDNAQAVLAVQDGAALNFGTSDFTIMVLARCDSDGFLGCVFDDTTVQRPELGLKVYCNVQGSPYILGATAPDRAQLRLADTALSAQYGVVVSSRDDTPDALHLYVARRSGDGLQLRMDGELQGETPVASNFNRNEPLFVGSCTANSVESSTTTFRGALAAVIVIEGPLANPDLTALETFVLATMGPGAPPLP